ncbi:MAG: 3-hydroxyacyl-CoA dehydrogenase [Acidimicrobiia bacterium]|nr:3-hydroxyacyl-CoA dehydrogenase [Acidimicrobiia bacterium]
MSVGGHGSAKVAVAGGGQIGAGWAIVFARAGFDVAVYEPAASRRRDAPGEIEIRLGDLAEHGLLEEPPAAIRARIAMESDLEEAVRNAVHVQECAPERLDVKVALFRALDGLADPGTTLGSSSSAMTISQIAAELPHRSRCLLAHPGNPPYLIRVVELAPAPFTAPETVDSVRDLFSRAGMVPITVRQEVDCLVFNRLQGALLREALCLVRDGVVTPEDLELVLTEGLGLRWSVIGPFTTADLNTRGGIRAHAEGVGAAYARLAVERGDDNPWESDVVKRVAEDLEFRFPESGREDRVLWRDRALMRLQADRSHRPGDC